MRHLPLGSPLTGATGGLYRCLPTKVPTLLPVPKTSSMTDGCVVVVGATNHTPVVVGGARDGDTLIVLSGMEDHMAARKDTRYLTLRLKLNPADPLATETPITNVVSAISKLLLDRYSGGLSAHENFKVSYVVAVPENESVEQLVDLFILFLQGLGYSNGVLRTDQITELRDITSKLQSNVGLLSGAVGHIEQPEV